MYEDGLPGNTPDTQKALYWYSQAADVGHPGAQNNLGLMYEHGVGVQPNFEQAAVWCAVVLALLFFFQFLSFCEFFFEVLLKLDFFFIAGITLELLAEMQELRIILICGMSMKKERNKITQKQ